MSKTENFKNQIKKNRPTALSNYIGEEEGYKKPEKENKNNHDNEKENNDDLETYVNNDNNKNNNEENVVNNEDDYFKRLAQGKKPKPSEYKKKKKVFTSFYMDPDLAAEIDKMMKNAEKGDKSKLLNTAIRKLLVSYGVDVDSNPK